MDMKEPHHFNSMPGLKRTTRKHQMLFSWPMLTLVWLIWMLVNVWSIWVVGKGLIATGNFVDFPDWAMYCFATCIQSVIALGITYVAYCFRGGVTGWISAMLILVICPTLLMGEVFHQMIAQIKSGQGANLQQVHQTRLTTLHQSVSDIAMQIALVYSETTESFKTNAENAANGKDQSRIAKPGAIYRGYIGQYQKALPYGDLSGAFPSPASGDLRAKHTDLLARIQMLRNKNARLSEYLIDVFDDKNRKSPAHISNGISAVSTEANSLTSFYSAMNDITDQSLAREEAFEFPMKLWRGEPLNKQSVLAAGYGLASAMMLVVLGIVIRLISKVRDPANVGDVNHLVKQAKLEREAWDTLAKERMEADIAKVFAKTEISEEH